MKSISIKTHSQFCMINITSQIQNIVYESGIADGIVRVFVPHTTAAVTINEGADPAVVKDIIKELDKIVLLRDNYYTWKEIPQRISSQHWSVHLKW